MMTMLEMEEQNLVESEKALETSSEESDPLPVVVSCNCFDLQYIMLLDLKVNFFGLLRTGIFRYIV